MRHKDMIGGISHPMHFGVVITSLAFAFASWLTCSEELEPPVASIVAPYTALVGAVVQLDGSGSVDPEGARLIYMWSFRQLPPNSHAVLNDASLIEPAFVADQEGTYIIELVVSNGLLESLPALHTIEVGPCGGHPPTVAAISTNPAGPVVGDTVRFSAQVTDEDLGDECNLPQSFSYRWRLLTVPAGSLAVLADAQQSNPWLVADRSGAYAIELTVTDSSGWSSQSFAFNFSVSTCGEAAPEVLTVTAAPLNPALGEMVVLSATVVDPDNEPACNLDQSLNYHWQLTQVPVSSQALVERPDLETTWFWPDVSGDYTVTLVVTDSTGRVSEATHLTLTAGPCGDFAPVIDAVYADPEEPDVGDIVTLSADVYDPDNEEGCDANQDLFYDWRIVAGPAGTLARIEEPTWEETWFVPDLPGDYLIRLVVTDSTGLASEPGEVLVTVGACGSRPPVIEGIAANPLAPNTGDRVALTVTVTDEDVEDPCNDVSQYLFEWWFQAKPAGSLAVLSDTTLSNPTFRADMPGDYVVNARVTDQRGLTSQVAQLVVTASECGAAPPVATLTADPPAPLIGQPVLLRAEVTDADMDDGTEDDTCTLPESFTYLWRFVEMPEQSLSAIELPSSQNASFTPDSPGVYVIECVVHDAMGHRNVAADEGDLFVEVTAADCGDAIPSVVAVMAAPGAPRTGDIVLLTAEIEDADQDCVEDQQLFTFDWRFIEMPSGSLAQLNDGGAENPWFEADTPGPFKVRLVVTDSTGRGSRPYDFTVTVSPCGDADPQVDLVVPSTTAPNIGQRVDLAITVSDADTNIGGCNMVQELDVTSWFIARPAGSTAVLSPPEGLQPSFVPDVPGAYEIRTRVTDNTGRYGEKDTMITATECGGAPPTVDDVTVTVNGVEAPRIDTLSLVTLEVSVSDADNPLDEFTPSCLGTGVSQTLTVVSSFVSLPAGSQAQLAPAEGLTPSFVADVPGFYVVRIRVTDDTGLFSEHDQEIEIHTCGSNPPQVVLGRVGGGDLLFNTGDLVELQAQESDLDVSSCGITQVLTIETGFITRPAGSHAQFSPAEGKYPAFVADVPGFYVVRTEVSDGTGNTGYDIETIDVDECGNATPTVTIAVTGTLRIGEPIELAITPDDIDTHTNPGDCGLVQTLTVHSAFVERPAGSNATLSPAEGRTPSFIPDVDGDYVVRCTVDDGTGRSSFTDTDPITITPCGGNAPYIVEPWFISPLGPGVGDLVTLTITASDLDETTCSLPQVRTLSSRFIQRPAGSTAVLSPSEGFNPAFVADRAGLFLIRATVTDETGRSSYMDLPVNIDPCGGHDPTAAVEVVLVDDVEFTYPLTEDIDAGSRVTLIIDTGDLDVDTTPPDNCTEDQTFLVSSEFVQRPPGSTASLTPAEGIQPTFIPDVRGLYVIRTTVTDSTGRTGVALIEVPVGPCGDNSPVISGITVASTGGMEGQIDTGDVVTLAINATDMDTDGGGDTCDAGQTITYSSVFLSLPSGSTAVLNPAQGPEPSFVPDVWGTYVIRSTVLDDTGRSAFRDTTVNVVPCGDNAPDITSITPTVGGATVPIAAGDMVVLVVVAEDADNDEEGCDLDQSLTYQAQFLSLPPGSMTVLNPAVGDHPAFVPDVNGTYVVRVTVEDGTGRSDVMDLPIEVIACGDNTPAFDAITVTPEAPNTTELVYLNLGATDVDNTDTDCCPGAPAVVCQSLTYQSWFISRPWGSSAELSPAEGVTPAFVADRPGEYIIRSMVEDGTGRSSTFDTTVLVDDCGSMAPEAVITVIEPLDATIVGEATVVSAGSTVVLDGSTSTGGEDVGCLTGNEVTGYHWTFLGVPAGSLATFTNTEVMQPHFAADVPGLYVVELTVSDGYLTGSTRINVVADPALALIPSEGLAVELVAGPGPLWDQPEGIAFIESTGEIFVAQNGSDTVTVTTMVGTAWVTEAHSIGLWLNNIHDMAYFPTSTGTFLLVSNETDDVIIRVDLTTGGQELWSTPGAVVRPAGIDAWDTGTDGFMDYLATVDQTNRRIVVFDSSGGSPQYIPLESGFSFLNPWGMQAEVVGGNRRFWATSNLLGYLERLSYPTPITYRTLTSILNGPRDILYTPPVGGTGNGAILVADSSSGRVLRVTDCTMTNPDSTPCTVVPLLSGMVRPYGLSFGPGNSVLVTDRGTNTLYRLWQTDGSPWW